MTRRSKIVIVALAAAFGFGSLALAEAAHSRKAGTGHGSQAAKAARQGANAFGSFRTPTYGAPNPNSPVATGGGSTGYNTNLYNYWSIVPFNAPTGLNCPLAATPYLFLFLDAAHHEKNKAATGAALSCQGGNSTYAFPRVEILWPIRIGNRHRAAASVIAWNLVRRVIWTSGKDGGCRRNRCRKRRHNKKRGGGFLEHGRSPFSRSVPSLVREPIRGIEWGRRGGSHQERSPNNQIIPSARHRQVASGKFPISKLWTDRANKLRSFTLFAFCSSVAKQAVRLDRQTYEGIFYDLRNTFVIFLKKLWASSSPY
jgi:hypothetical protein